MNETTIEKHFVALGHLVTRLTHAATELHRAARHAEEAGRALDADGLRNEAARFDVIASRFGDEYLAMRRALDAKRVSL